MISFEMEDLIGVLQGLKPYFIAIAALLIAAIVITVAVGKKREETQIPDPQGILDRGDRRHRDRCQHDLLRPHEHFDHTGNRQRPGYRADHCRSF